jgi:uncharacterized protein (DUF1330 family)
MEMQMSVYLVAQLSFKDRERYARYQERFMSVLQHYRGAKLLVAEEHPQQIEGRWSSDKLVIVSFPDQATFRQWSESAEYQEILADRKAGADAVVVLARGISEITSGAAAQ